MTRTTDIFIRSFHRDRYWLALALRSIAAFVSGHRRVVVVVPRSSLGRMEPTDIASHGVQLRVCGDYADDYLGQQVTKLHADLYTDADVILHLDSDQVFVAPCDLSARLFDRGRPRMAWEQDSVRPRTDGWRRCPTAFLGEPVQPDVTGPPPLVVPRDVYPRIRAFCRETHGMSIRRYAFAVGAAQFCEFALLRGFVLAREPERCAWVESDRHPLLPECRNFWSRTQTPDSVAGSLPAELTAGTPPTAPGR
jgi:hypothetical protein